MLLVYSSGDMCVGKKQTCITVDALNGTGIEEDIVYLRRCGAYGIGNAYTTPTTSKYAEHEGLQLKR